MINWLLRNNPALLGDLQEERASGRSRTWLWRQVAVAVLRSLRTDIRHHPILLLRGIVIGLITYIVCAFLEFTAAGFLVSYLRPAGWTGDVAIAFEPPVAILAFLAALVTGWAIARTHRPCAAAAIGVLLSIWCALGDYACLAFARSGDPFWFHNVEVMLWILFAGQIGGAAGAWLEVWKHERST